MKIWPVGAECFM